MRNHRSLHRSVACAFPILAILVVAGGGFSAFADNTTTAYDFRIERPTLHCAGFEWDINGDDNRTASVDVSYRKLGDMAWKKAMPLLRIHGEKIYFGEYFTYDCPNMFAGSIFNLEPGTTYECRFTLSDVDGITGDAVRTVRVTTRSVPPDYQGERILHVYPPDYEGEREEPSFTGLSHAYFGKGQGFWGSPTVRPGDVILVHAGLYKSDMLTYYEPNGLHFHGSYVLTQSGTPDKPIVIRAAGDGEAIFDGNGCYRLFDVMYADHTYIEGLTIKNCDVAVYAGVRYAHGCDGLVVRNCRMEHVGCGVLAQYTESKDFYIADNIIIGRDDPTRLTGWGGLWTKVGKLARLDSFIGIDINGQGHVICHNYIARFHDAIDITEQGPPEAGMQKAASIDIYNNDMYHMADDFIEADCSAHNVRVFNNRGFNAAHHGLSAQPIYGGPAYFIRNIVYHVPPGGAFKFNIYPAGIYAWHNTLCAEWGSTPPYSNVHLRNNLILGIDRPDWPILRVQTYTSYTSFDFNGYRPNASTKHPFVWRGPQKGDLRDYSLDEHSFYGEYISLDEFREATGQEQHGFLVDYDIFKNVTMPDYNDPSRLYNPDIFDFSLRDKATAIDKGCVLPNINDNYNGSAPDAGAIETGSEPMVYGPRN